MEPAGLPPPVLPDNRDVDSLFPGSAYGWQGDATESVGFERRGGDSEKGTTGGRPRAIESHASERAWSIIWGSRLRNGKGSP